MSSISRSFLRSFTPLQNPSANQRNRSSTTAFSPSKKPAILGSTWASFTIGDGCHVESDPLLWIADVGGNCRPPIIEAHPLPLHATESMLSEVRDGIHYPAVTVARETLLSWRFYHHFPTDARSLLRQPTIGSWSPVLEADGGNLAANLRTLIECQRSGPLDEVVEMAFPGCQWSPMDDSGRFQLQLLRPGLKRWLDAAELSDGTLRFFCLCAALLTPKPPPLMIINEPEASPHPELLAPLAKLIAGVAADTQILLVTHSRELAGFIADACESRTVDLVSYEGETRPSEVGSGGSRRVWIFDGD